MADYLGGKRIDAIVSRALRNYTRFRVHRLVRTGAVRVDGHPVPIGCRAYPGQRVSVRLVEPPDKLLRATPMSLEIVHEDASLLAVSKPAGCIIHPARQDTADAMINGLQDHLDRHNHPKGLLRPGIVHRLDRDTSGLLLATKDHVAHRRLSRQFQDRSIAKTYLAIVEGHPDLDHGTIDFPLGQTSASDSILVSAAADAIAPRSALTEFIVLQRLRGCTLLEVHPRTGRLHQIRVHLAAIGHPLLGEPFYGPRGVVRQDRDGRWLVPRAAPTPWPDASRQALHALALEFVHPHTEEPTKLVAAPPDDFRHLLEQAGCKNGTLNW